MARRNNQKRVVRVLTRKVQQERRANRKRRAHTPVAAEQVVTHIRGAIGRHVAQLTKRINANPHKIAAAAITASFGADAAALAGYLAAGAALGAVPSGTSGQ